MAEPALSGWSISAGFAGADEVGNFFALYEGERFGAPERGLLAVMARAHVDARMDAAGARAAVRSAVHSFAEGYFGARRTLSPGKAAAAALASVNRWLAGQVQGGALVSLSALLLRGRRVGLVQLGACQMYQLRGTTLTPLMQPHLQPVEQAPFIPARALGRDTELTLDLGETEAEVGDVYLLIAGLNENTGVYSALLPLLARAGEEGLADATLAALAGLPAQDKSVMALHVQAVPDSADDGLARAALAHLPIRPAPRAGDMWDGFKIGHTLFRGRYTVLMAARDLQNNQDVALKIPLAAMLQDEVFTAGFMREAWVGSAVHSQNVVQYIELPPERRSALYLVMPLYQGETLEKRLNHAPLMSLPEGMGIAFRLCQAVQDLAAIEVVHRDLKPDNVMLLETGEVRLLDLGLAYLPGIDATNAARPGGTIRYMAPELLKDAPASARTEVYALAVSFYRMFSGGAFPYGQHERRPLARVRPDLPGWLGEALAKGLAPKPEARFADAGEFAHALQIGMAEGRDTPPPERLAFGTFSALQFWRGLALLLALLLLLSLARWAV